MKKGNLRKKVEKRYRQENHKLIFQDVGSLIKEKRKELRITQELAANGICSVSYLSKIENNQISPNEYYVKEIMEKLDVDEGFYQKTIDDRKYLMEMVQAIFYDDLSETSRIYNEISIYKHNIAFSIAKLGYIAHHNLWDDDSYIMMLESLVANMDDYELKAFLLFEVLYYIGKDLYKLALESYMTYLEVPFKDEFFDALASNLSFIIIQETQVAMNYFNDYDIAKSIYQKYHSYKRLINLRFTYIEYLLSTNTYKAKLELEKINVNSLEQNQLDRYHLCKAHILFDNKKYNDSTIMLKSIENHSTYYFDKLVLLYEICKINKDSDMMTHITTLINSLPMEKVTIKKKIYYHYLLQKDENETKTFLREIAVPFSIKVSDMNALLAYTEKLMDICIMSSRYKEATLHYKKYKKEYTKIKNIAS